MKYKVLIALVVVGLVVLVFMQVSPWRYQQQEIPPQDWVVANETEFLSKCEQCNISFEKYDFGDAGVTYYYQRMIGNATVLGDSMNYQFDKDGKFEKKLVHWTPGLPDKLPPIISEDKALTIGGGTRAELVYIELGEPTFTPIDTTNPCWAVSVYNSEGWNIDIVVVDAVTREVLGHGAPVP